MESSLELHPKLLWMEHQREEENRRKRKQRGGKKSKVLSNFLTCARHSSTLLRVVAMLRTSRDKYFRALPRKRLK